MAAFLMSSLPQCTAYYMSKQIWPAVCSQFVLIIKFYIFMISQRYGFYIVKKFDMNEALMKQIRCFKLRSCTQNIFAQIQFNFKM